MKNVEIFIYQVHGFADLFQIGQSINFGQHFFPAVSGFCLVERYAIFLLHEFCGFGLTGCGDHPSDDINFQGGETMVEFLIIHFSKFGEVLIEQEASYGFSEAA